MNRERDVNKDIDRKTGSKTARDMERVRDINIDTDMDMNTDLIRTATGTAGKDRHWERYRNETETRTWKLTGPRTGLDKDTETDMGREQGQGQGLEQGQGQG
jgi:hypothetical protein